MLRSDFHEKVELNEQDSLFLNSNLTTTKTTLEIPTKCSVDSLHESSRTIRDLSKVFNEQEKEFDNNKLTNLDSISVNRDLSSDNEHCNKKHKDDKLDKSTILRCNQTLDNYLEVSVGNDVQKLTK